MENLQLVIRAGLPLRQGIIDLAEDSENKKFKNMLFQIADDVNKGKSLSAFKCIAPTQDCFYPQSWLKYLL